MGSQRHDFLLSQDGSDAAVTSLAGRALPADLVQQVSNLTMGQLFYILNHIQKLSSRRPVTAQHLLAEHPNICYALLHAECLAGMVEEPMLPMTAEELKRAKAKAKQMQEDVEGHELPPPPPGLVEGASAKAMAHSAFSKFGNMPHAQSKAAAAQPPMPGVPPMGTFGGLGGIFSGGGAVTDEQQKQHLLQKVKSLSPEQIARLPEHVKGQLLQFLQQQQQAQQGQRPVV